MSPFAVSAPAARALALGAALIAATSAGCLEELEPDVGPALAPRCVNGDSDPDRDVSFSRHVVRRVFGGSGHCLACHRPDAPNPIGFEIGGLDLSTYAGVRAGGAVSRADAVIPGRPCDSTLVQKLTAGPPFGARMPLDGPPFVDDADVLLLADWIVEGAQDD